MRDLRSEAKKLVKMRDIALFPGWNFATADSLNDKRAIERKKIWKFFNPRKRHPEIVVNWDMGLKLSLKLGDDISWCLFVGGQIDPNELVFIKKLLKRGMVVVDVGANCGIYSLVSSKRVGNSGKVFAFEPSSRERKLLNRNIRLNSCDNVRVLPVALLNSKTTRLLHVASDHHNGQNAFGKFIYPSVVKVKDQLVKVTTLDDAVERLGISRLDLLKIDTEGTEYSVLLGGKKTIKKFKPVILIEIPQRSIKRQSAHTAKLFSLLRSMKFSLYYFDKLTGMPTRITKSNRIIDLSLNIIAIPA